MAKTEPTVFYLILPEALGSKDEYIQLKTRLREVTSYIASKKDVEIFYDESNLDELLAWLESEDFQATFGTLNPEAALKQQNFRTAKRINKPTENSSVFFFWDYFSVDHITQVENSSAFFNILQYCFTKEVEKAYILNFNLEDKELINRTKVSAFLLEVEPLFIRVHFFHGNEDFENWKNYYEAQKGFSLEGNEDFEFTGRINAGERVYKELKTGYIWYKDSYHDERKHSQTNPHYEVFNKKGKHVGEANVIDGEIDKSKKDENKEYKI